jgi:hypothetical protein
MLDSFYPTDKMKQFFSGSENTYKGGIKKTSAGGD